MKKLMFSLASFCTILLCLAPAKNVNAQALVPPSLPDNTWYYPCGAFTSGLNTAMIDYKEGGGTFGTLMVSAYYGNGNPGGLGFMDLGSGYTISIPFCPSGPSMNGTPDIIVGNDPTNPVTDYRVAVAHHSSIDFYLVHYTGAMPGPFTVTALTTLTLPITNPNGIHIDVIAQQDNVGLTALPFCDNFVVTWGDGVPPSATVYAAYGALSTTSISAPVPISNGFMPDVAAIQRATCATCTTHDEVACIVFERISSVNQLYYVEHDFTAGTTTIPMAIGPSYPTTFSYTPPRIDAPDNYHINFPTGGFSYYKATAAVENPASSTSTSYTYDNLLGPGTWQNSMYCPGLYDASPCIAYGGNHGTDYQVAHYNSISSGTAIFFMEPINWTNPSSLASPPNYFYQVNTNPVGTGVGNYQQTSISTPCNNVADLTLTAWTDVATGTWTIYYKTTHTLAGGTYQFRYGALTTPVAATADEWQLYPNPANTVLNVNNPGGSYEITDMLGRMQLKGTLTEGLQPVDISALAPGSYIFTGYKGDVRDHSAVIVKQ